MISRTLLKRAGVVTVAVTALIVGVSAPASAHSMTRYMRTGGDFCCTLGHVYVSTDHRTILVCDDNPDGNGAWVDFWVSPGNGGDEYHGPTLSDPNGSADGCGTWTAPGSAKIHSFNGHIKNTNYSTGWWNVT